MPGGRAWGAWSGPCERRGGGGPAGCLVPAAGPAALSSHSPTARKQADGIEGAAGALRSALHGGAVLELVQHEGHTWSEV